MANWIQRLLTRMGSPAGASISADIADVKADIAALALSQGYQEQVGVDFDLDAIPTTLASPPPAPTAANTVFAIGPVADTVYALRSLWVSITSFGATGTQMTFSLWTYVNAVVTEVDSVDVKVLGLQNLTDLFGLAEVHSEGIWITAKIDAGTATGACEGTVRYALVVLP